jgi:hypothetical protein
MSTIKLRGKINFPATVTGTGGLQVVKANGIWTVSPNFAGLTSIPASSVADPTTQQVWIYNPTANSYAVLTLAALGDALFKLTSNTSLLIGTGSKVFATQTNKDIGVGQYVLIVSDAAPSTNFMFGQITAYANGSLTVNVTVIGGSGTFADWTIRIAGVQGPIGVTGVSPGIRQAYSATTTDADPGNGIFRLNNATPASATAAYLDNLDSGGSTVSTLFDLWDDSTATTKGFVRFEKSGDPTIWAQFAVTGSVVDGTGYRKLTLANGAGSGAFIAADTFAITFYRTGDNGAVAGPGVSVDSEIALWNGVGGSTLKRASGTGIAALTSGVLSVSGTATTATFGTIELGAATDTTISRVSAGVVAVEGVNVLTTGTGAAQGKQTIWIPSTAMISRTTNGPSAGTVELATNKVMVKSLDFDTTTQEFCQFSVWFPKSWNLGTVTFQPSFSQLTTAAGGVVFGLAGVAVSDTDDLDAAFGTAQTSTKTAGTLNKDYQGPESAAITIAGTPTAGDRIIFQINRTVADGSDTLAQDARLHGVKIFFTTNASTDT